MNKMIDSDDDDDPRGPGADTYDPLVQADIKALDKHTLEERERNARGLLETRKGAYTRVFIKGTPSVDDRKLVTDDLKRFCRGDQTAYSENDRTHCLLTGRQEVYWRITDFTKMSVDELVDKYNR